MHSCLLSRETWCSVFDSQAVESAESVVVNMRFFKTYPQKSTHERLFSFPFLEAFLPQERLAVTWEEAAVSACKKLRHGLFCVQLQWVSLPLFPEKQEWKFMGISRIYHRFASHLLSLTASWCLIRIKQQHTLEPKVITRPPHRENHATHQARYRD